MGTRRIASIRNKIRTHGTRHLNENQERHELYMRLTVLEIERNRRNAEKVSLLERLNALDQRIADVDAEQSLVQSLLDKLATGIEIPEPQRSFDVFRY